MGNAIASEPPPPGAGFTAVKDRLPALETSAAVNVTLACVALAMVVDRALPLTSITVEDRKLVPVTVITGDAAPTTSDAGFNAERVGDGLAATTATAVAVEVPPPGVGFTAVRERLVAAATSAAVSATLTWVELVKVVLRAAPFTLMTVVGTKPVPVTVMTAGVAPVSSLAGATEVMAGVGLSTSRLIGELMTDPSRTTTANSAPLTNWLAGTVAVSCVLLP